MKLLKKKTLNAMIGLALGMASQAASAGASTLTYQGFFLLSIVSPEFIIID